MTLRQPAGETSSDGQRDPVRRTRVRVAGVALIPIALLALLGLLVPTPYVAMSPGPTFDTLGEFDGKTVVEVPNAHRTSGQLRMVTVNASSNLSVFAAMFTWFSKRYQVSPRDTVYEPTKTTDEITTENRGMFTDSESAAESAAFGYLISAKRIAGAAEIAGVGANVPATGKLRAGDQFVAIDGKPVSVASDVTAAIAAKGPGQPVSITVNRGGAPLAVSVTLGTNPNDAARGYLGITVQSVPAGPQPEVKFNLEDVGGPSAGMMFALAIIDKMTTDDLADHRVIAGTGTIDANGAVGPIGGITHKMVGAREDGATVFLVPAANCAEAKTDIPDGLTLIKVDTLTSAVAALEAPRTGKPVPSC